MSNQNYEKAKAECWEAFWDEISGSIDSAPGVPDRMQEHVYATFDRAYTLGKQAKDVEEFKVSDLIVKLMPLDKEELNYIVYTLMFKGKIDYHEIMDIHIKHLEYMKRGASDAYARLSGMVIKMFCDTKKNYNSNLKEIMHDLCDRGCANVTHDEIDRK